jgi:hypothetical protein
MGARDGTKQIPDTAIGTLTDKERDLIEGVVFVYLEWCTWWIDEDLKSSEAQNSEKNANKPLSRT